jgi:hypothetical protein
MLAYEEPGLAISSYANNQNLNLKSYLSTGRFFAHFNTTHQRTPNSLFKLVLILYNKKSVLFPNKLLYRK